MFVPTIIYIRGIDCEHATIKRSKRNEGYMKDTEAATERETFEGLYIYIPVN